ncbi:LacI family DNA-binding transcriptional regulator [Propionibacterium australiense]|uniref:LacI family transcriptional regulator n=1 Tax=Propionibacterium australiense TaxID=119981 RepID=A0A8B3GI97_9ACTN|nr:LacI family DNA-binding transcriptional regulator [Propionibacterium australiense]RLP12797.1 LacI family transcriptional regulator [Propionibacterium australiense]
MSFPDREAHATQQDVAARAGVSRGLVSLALKGEGRMSDQTRQRILDAAQALHYHPNAAAAELAARHSRRLAVILPYLDNPFFDRLLRRLRHHASAAGYVLVVLVSDLEDQLEQTTVDDVLSMRPAGLILPGTSMSQSELLALSGHMPLCVLDRALDEPSIPTVRLDEAGAAAQIAGHLAEQGFERMVFFSPAHNRYESLLDERREACREASAAGGLDFAEIACDDGASQALMAARATSAGPFGAVAYNDVLGIDLIAATLSARLTPGPDLAVISYDNSSLASRREVSLTSVDQSPDRLAEAAIAAVLAPREDPAAHVTVPATLVIRASSRRRPPRG